VKFEPGEDIVVDFDGVHVPGEVIRQSNGWVMATVDLDPEIEWTLGARLHRRSTVCVPETRVSHAEQKVE